MVTLTGRELVQVTPVSVAGVPTSIIQTPTTQDIANLGGGGGTPGSPTLSIQYNNAGSFAGSATFTTNGAGQQTSSGLTTTSPGFYAQITGDTVPRVRVGVNANDVGSIGFGSGAGTRDLFLERPAAATLRIGATDSATPVAQTIVVQNVITGTTDTAGANFTVSGSAGTGTGVGGSLIFQIAPAGSTGTSVNALATALTINSTKAATFTGSIITSFTGLVSTPAETLSGSWFTGGSTTTTKPMLLIEPSGTTSTGWSTSGTGLGINAATGITGFSIDCQIAGVSKFNVRAATGNIITAGTITAVGALVAAAGTFSGLLTGSAGVTVASGQVLKLGNAATTGLGAGVLAALTNASIVITDSTGQAYRIPCII